MTLKLKLVELGSKNIQVFPFGESAAKPTFAKSILITVKVGYSNFSRFSGFLCWIIEFCNFAIDFCKHLVKNKSSIREMKKKLS